ncbi:class III cytochrome C family protein [bacterium BMS3Abin02]|nr:class III cytochrome C family protein [bacterium BMS3Abin02]
MTRLRYVVVGVLGLFLVLLAAGCDNKGAEPTTTTSPPQTTTTTTTTTAPPAVEPVVEIPFLADWQGSGHADASAQAFNHWNDDDPAVIPTSCAKCHSTPGFQDYVGADGTAFGTVDADAAIGTTVECVACHNDATLKLDHVTMPSGVEITGLGAEARCMTCHQGRAWKGTVDEAVQGIDEDTVSEDLGFINIHYFAAAATKYGTVTKGGYEYDGKSYDAVFTHVEGYATCIQCHDQHTLELKVDECSTCHAGVSSVEDLENVRMAGSEVDYDGDGDITEGIAFEIQGLQEKLYAAIQAYASSKAGTPIVYAAESYPYFFVDTNANGDADGEEASYGNKYASWTPRLLKAAYNYQVSIKDPGAYAHGGKYIIELLIDSTDDLNSVLSSPIAMTDVHRIDAGHFAGSEAAFRHWDKDGEVAASCSKCHSATGLPLFFKEGVTIAQPLSNGLLCSTCHSDLSTFDRYEVASVTFPSGAKIDSGSNNMNLCMTCHQGRESTVSVDKLIGDTKADVVSDSLRFLNVHYFAAGATIFGDQAKGAYEYTGKTYVGYNEDHPLNQCTQCHDQHALEVQVDKCSACHGTVANEDDLHAIRMSSVDYDGDGDTTEGMWDEIQTMRDDLLAAIQAYAAKTAGAEAIVYDPGSYPYYFVDTNGDGVAGADEANYGNRYGTWTPRLLRAAYNYQYATKDPGGFAHNGEYIVQTLYDSIKDVGGDVSGMTRP